MSSFIIYLRPDTRGRGRNSSLISTSCLPAVVALLLVVCSSSQLGIDPFPGGDASPWRNYRGKKDP